MTILVVHTLNSVVFRNFLLDTGPLTTKERYIFKSKKGAPPFVKP
jgi:hypothetical protein